MSNTTFEREQQGQEPIVIENKPQTQSEIHRKQLSEKARSNLSELDLELVSCSAYFKPIPEKTYLIHIDPEDHVERIENPRFATKDPKTGEMKIPVRYEFKISHPNNGAQQLWTVSKSVALQLSGHLGANETLLYVTRHGTDRSTTYTIESAE
jgi:hypothetical protein